MKKIGEIDGGGQAIRKLREQARLSLADVADILGWDKGRLSKYENNQLTLTLPTIEAIAGALDQRPEVVLLECLRCIYPALRDEDSRVGTLLQKAIDEMRR